MFLISFILEGGPWICCNNQTWALSYKRLRIPGICGHMVQLYCYKHKSKQYQHFTYVPDSDHIHNMLYIQHYWWYPQNHTSRKSIYSRILSHHPVINFLSTLSPTNQIHIPLLTIFSHIAVRQKRLIQLTQYKREPQYFQIFFISIKCCENNIKTAS